MTVSRANVNKDDLNGALSDLLTQLGGIKTFVSPGDRVLLKPNFNTSDPYPASTDPIFLMKVVERVLQAEPKSIVIGDASTIMLNTENVLTELKIRELEKVDSRVTVMNFRKEPWQQNIVPNGKYLQKVRLPAVLDDIDSIILLPCLKTHRMAQFTGSLKLAVGMMHPMDRIGMHMSHLQEKIAEVNLLFKPKLIIMDGRKCFITGGPESGELREPNVLLASESRIAIDIEAVKIIQSYPGNSIAEIEAEQVTHIRIAKEIGVI